VPTEVVDGGAAPSTGQRRQVTILFCDLVGSTALSEQLDPEDLAELVLAYQQIGAAAAAEFGGHVAQYLGDGLLVIFGYPRAFEDAAERAVRTGAAVLQRIVDMNDSLAASYGVRLAARVGVATGVSVVGKMGDAGRVDTSAFGQTINLAARLEGLAAPGEIVVSDTTGRLVRHCCELDDLGFPELKGIQPTRVWRVAGMATPGAVRQLHGSAFVGRTAPLARLHSWWGDVVARTAGALIVEAEAGLGKSRLVAEFVDRSGIVSMTLSCSPLRTATSLWPVLRLLGERRHALGADGLSIAAWAEANGVDGAELLDGLEEARLAPGGDRELGWRRTLAALADLLAVTAPGGPCCVVAEDMHWADASTREVLGHLAERRDGRLGVLATTRPGDELERIRTDPHDVLVLDHLDEDESRRLVEELLGTGDGPDPSVVDAVVARAEGIPLFLEELAATVGDQGLAGGVPATLQDVLLARFDALGDAATTARVASAFGRDVNRRLLEGVVGDAGADLGVLVASNLLLVVDPEAEPSERVYTFRHVLLRDVLYDTMLRRERQAVHARIASLLLADDPGIEVLQPQLLARHFERAGDSHRAAGLLLDGGRRAGARGAYQESVELLRAGLTVAEGIPEASEREPLESALLQLLGNSMMAVEGYGAAQLLSIWERAIELTGRLGDDDGLTSMLNGAATYYFDSGDVDRAADLARRILEIGDQTGSRVANLRGHCTLSLCELYLGWPSRVVAHGTEAIDHYCEGDFETVTAGLGTDHLVIALCTSAVGMWNLGSPDTALTLVERAVQHAEVIGSRLSYAMATAFVAIVRTLRGEFEEVLETCDALRKVADPMQFTYWVGFADLLGGGALGELGYGDEGLETIGRGLTTLATSGSVSGASLGFWILARGQAAAGDLSGALATIDAALESSAATRQPFFDAELWRLKAELAAVVGATPAGELRRYLAQAAVDAGRRSQRSIQLRCSLTGVALADGADRAPALERLRSVVAEFDEGHSTRDMQLANQILTSTPTN